MIKPCTCKHEFQDREWGFAMRVHNPTRDGGWRCTVCGLKKGGGRVVVAKEQVAKDET